MLSEYSGVITVLVNRAITGKPLIIEGEGTQTRSFIYVEDVAEAAVLAAESERAAGEIFNITDTEPITIHALVHMIRELSKSNSEIVNNPPRRGDIRDSIGSYQKAFEQLGFQPTMSLEKGLQRTIEWFSMSSEK